jgi:DNA-binding response OmpR family regulator
LRILLLEDDLETARAVEAGLRAGGFDVLTRHDVPSALEVVEHYALDIAVLDLVVPGGSGYDVLRALRRHDPGVPVLILSALDAVSERVAGIERGADDYLVKPFAFAELLARVRGILRRPAKRIEPFVLGNLRVDPLQRVAAVGDRALDLSQKEFDLLRSLIEVPGEVRNRAELLDKVWGIRFDPGTNVIDVHVSRLRSKLRLAGAEPSIQTRRGVGYVLA